MTSMLSLQISRILGSRALRTDVLVVASLIGLDVVARLLPHAPDFTPMAATALFAASTLRTRALAVLVPTAGMALGDAALGFYDLRVMVVVYAALTLPACVAFLPRRFCGPRLIALLLPSCSLIFFTVTNFAVWAFSPFYAPNAAGLVKCYVAALPFWRNMLAGDLLWSLVLFGLYSLAQAIHTANKEPLTVHAIAA
jgi:hypothetical protein